MRPVAIAVGLALLLGACGVSTSPAEESPAPSQQTSANGSSSPAAGAPEPAAAETKTSDAKTAAAPASPGTPAPEASPRATLEVVPYFYIDEPGRRERTGPFLLPVARVVEKTPAVARAAIEQLLAGPSDDEVLGVPPLSSAIPAGVALLGLTIEDGIAVVDLSSEFAIDDDSAAVAARVAQVVYTLTRFDTVDRVRFLQQGQEVKVPTSDGSLVGGSVARSDFLDFAAAIFVESPAYGAKAEEATRVTGFAAVFEASFRYALTDDDGLVVEDGVAMTSNGMGWGTFDFTISHDWDAAQHGSLIVWAHSPEDGSQIDVREYPLLLTP